MHLLTDRQNRFCVGFFFESEKIEKNFEKKFQNEIAEPSTSGMYSLTVVSG